MGIETRQVEIRFTSRELEWLERQANRRCMTLERMIHTRALNRDGGILDSEIYERFGTDRTKMGELLASREAFEDAAKNLDIPSKMMLYDMLFSEEERELLVQLRDRGT